MMKEYDYIGRELEREKRIQTLCRNSRKGLDSQKLEYYTKNGNLYFRLPRAQGRLSVVPV